MSITVEQNGSVASIVLSGGIDYGTQEDFKKANTQALSIEGITEIFVDFKSASFLDSAGIRALIDLKRRADAQGKSMVLLNCDKKMLDIFEIGGFDRIFSFR